MIGDGFLEVEIGSDFRGRLRDLLERCKLYGFKLDWHEEERVLASTFTVRSNIDTIAMVVGTITGESWASVQSNKR